MVMKMNAKIVRLLSALFMMKHAVGVEIFKYMQLFIIFHKVQFGRFSLFLLSKLVLSIPVGTANFDILA